MKKISGQKNIENFIQKIRDKRKRLHKKRMCLFKKTNPKRKKD